MQAEQLHVAKGLERQDCLVASHDRVGAAGNGTFQNPVVGFIGKDCNLAAGFERMDRSERNTATCANSSASRENFLARMPNSSSRMGLENRSWSLCSMIRRSALSARPPGLHHQEAG